MSPCAVRVSAMTRLTRQIRALSVGCAAVLMAAIASPLASADDGMVKADRILVLKSERKLMLMAGDSVVRSMNIALGLMPRGAKEQEGDFKTPEGVYFIEAKNPDSDYFLSLKVSYPNAADWDRARRLGVDPGGQIMIHGLPNDPKFDEASYSNWDWTDGCIAVSNSDMIDIWLMTANNTPIEILP